MLKFLAVLNYYELLIYKVILDDLKALVHKEW